jgi:hypothetical protein
MKIRRTLSRLYRELSLGSVVYKKPILIVELSGSVIYKKPILILYIRKITEVNPTHIDGLSTIKRLPFIFFSVW